MRGASRAWGVGIVGMLLLFCGLTPAQASSGEEPYGVSSSSVVQDGQHLVWRVALQSGFTAPGLAGSGRSLCLSVQAPGRPTGTLCVVPRHGHIALRFSSAGRSRRIAARISRSGPRQMSAAFLPSAVGATYTRVRWQVLSGQGSQVFQFPAHPALARLHVPHLVGCVPRGRSLVDAGPSDRREVALTFDDGPWGQPPTIDFLRTLERFHAPATFFEIGDQLDEFDRSGTLERRMLADGDMIGDHTWSHPQMTSLSPAAQHDQIARTKQAIRRHTSFTPCLWRPPYGAVNSSLVRMARAQGLLTINWDVDPRDWAMPGTGAIVGNVLSHSRSGSIVIQHFGGGPRYQTLAALPQEIRGLRSRGYKLVTVTQLLGLRLIYK